MTPLEAYLAGSIPAAVALMRLMLEGVSPSQLVDRLAKAAVDDSRLAPLLALARDRSDGLQLLARMVRDGAEHGPQGDPATAIAASRAMFDRLVQVSPEASVAAYSLGDPELLAAASGEIRDWLRVAGLLDGRPRILDLGCGIGRLAALLAEEAAGILGLDVSPGMIAAARARLPGLTFELCSGHDLHGLEAGSFDLVLAVDVFPYLAQGGLDLAAGMLAEAHRVLRPGGAMVILNLSYRGEAADRRDLPALAEAAGFALLRNGERAFTLWDGLVFQLRRR